MEVLDDQSRRLLGSCLLDQGNYVLDQALPVAGRDESGLGAGGGQQLADLGPRGLGRRGPQVQRLQEGPEGPVLLQFVGLPGPDLEALPVGLLNSRFDEAGLPYPALALDEDGLGTALLCIFKGLVEGSELLVSPDQGRSPLLRAVLAHRLPCR